MFTKNDNFAWIGQFIVYLERLITMITNLFSGVSGNDTDAEDDADAEA